MIMCANGVPEEVIVQIFQDAIHKIQGLKGRVMGGRMTKEDYRLLTICSDVGALTGFIDTYTGGRGCM